jgi:ribosomal protein L40E
MALIKCHECGHDVSTQADTCPNCGVAISKVETQQIKTTKFCSHCGAEIDFQAEICPKCGVRALWLKELMINGRKHLSKTHPISRVELSRICQNQIDFKGILQFFNSSNDLGVDIAAQESELSVVSKAMNS